MEELRVFILIIILFTGDVMTAPYPAAIDCENALFQKTDNGNLKKIKIAECIEVNK